MDRVFAATLSATSSNTEEWLSSSAEREYLYLVCGVVLITWGVLCCFVVFLCHHDTNRTKRLELQLDIEKLKRLPSTVSIKRLVPLDTVAPCSSNTSSNIEPVVSTLAPRIRSRRHSENDSTTEQTLEASTPNNLMVAVTDMIIPGRTRSLSRSHARVQMQGLPAPLPYPAGIEAIPWSL